MTEEVMHPLRRRMLEDVTVRNLSEGTQQVYIRSVRACCRYCNTKPSELTFEDVRVFRLHLVESGLAPGSVNGAMVGLRFFFRVTLRRPEALDYIPMAREPQRLPTVRRGGGAPAGGGAGAEVADRAQRRLRGGAAGVGGGGAEARRHPQRTDADPGRAGEGAA